MFDYFLQTIQTFGKKMSMKNWNGSNGRQLRFQEIAVKSLTNHGKFLQSDPKFTQLIPYCFIKRTHSDNIILDTMQ